MKKSHNFPLTMDGGKIGEIYGRTASLMTDPRSRGENSGKQQQEQNLQLLASNLPENTPKSSPDSQLPAQQQQIQVPYVAIQQQQIQQQLPVMIPVYSFRSAAITTTNPGTICGDSTTADSAAGTSDDPRSFR